MHAAIASAQRTSSDKLGMPHLLCSFHLQPTLLTPTLALNLSIQCEAHLFLPAT